MKLIIAEKSIAGERIAQLLADGGVITKTITGARVFEFKLNGEDIRLIPLRGHISDVEFPKNYSNWSQVLIHDLIDAKVIYTKKEYRIIDCIIDSAPLAQEIIIATDADREGEAIGLEAINYALISNKKINVLRAYFSAITKPDIQKAFNSLEKFDYNFADSANARREIDLIWGAALTRFVSLSSGQLGKNFLSVGRVQTPTLALIVNREKERLAFIKKIFWEITVDCEKDNKKFFAIHRKEKFFEKNEAQQIIDKKINELLVKSVNEKTKILKKPLPFNTTEFLRASTAIGISASKAMSLAENLYQKGFISYPRTDNKKYPVHLDLKEILNKLVLVDELKNDVEKILNQTKIIPSVGKETKDHPPIHPVSNVSKNSLTLDEWKIYELVCRRFLATLYKDAKTSNGIVILENKGEEFIARGQLIIDAGWKEVYFYSKLSEVVLPKLSVGDIVIVKKMNLFEKETIPPNRYSQGSLIKLMEKYNLGTKSTRPTIIQKLYSRNYISGNKSIEPSEVALFVINSLQKSCELVTQPKMTSDLEKEMDNIAAGKKEKDEVVLNSSKKLHEIISMLEKDKKDFVLKIKNSTSLKKIIGVCESCGKDLVIRKGKSGKRFVGCSGYPECNVTFALPQKGIITITKEKCNACSAPVIKVKNKNFNYKMCLNMNCKTKENWGNKNSKKMVDK